MITLWNIWYMQDALDEMETIQNRVLFMLLYALICNLRPEYGKVPAPKNK